MIYLRYQGYGPGDCARILGVHPNTITNWTKLYLAEGLSGLRQLSYCAPQSELVQYQSEISESFSLQAPHTVSEAAARIEQLSGLRRSLTQIRVFMKNCLQLKRRKLNPLPGGKRSLTQLSALQQAFLTQKLEPLINRALSGSIELFFVDATHAVMGFHSAYVWSQSPQAIRTSSGRYRVNLLGALHATDQGLYSIANDSYINAETVVELMEWLRENLPTEEIYLVMDNARYQRCNWVKYWAEEMNIELVFLPPYSPNLNLIERLWRFFKSKVLAGKYYQNKEDFEKAIFDFIDQVDQGSYQDNLKTLLTLEFQKLDKWDKTFSQKLAA